ncbi:MAG: MetS family NSS transporter small subunit [Rubrobacteraceae bacterium]
MGVGAWIMLIIGATLLWGGLIFFIAYYFRAERG